jgi:hypothetical protein
MKVKISAMSLAYASASFISTCWWMLHRLGEYFSRESFFSFVVVVLVPTLVALCVFAMSEFMIKIQPILMGIINVGVQMLVAACVCGTILGTALFFIKLKVIPDDNQSLAHVSAVATTFGVISSFALFIVFVAGAYQSFLFRIRLYFRRLSYQRHYH